MAQWVNRLRNNIFVNPPSLPFLCEIFGALHLVQRQAGRQADEIQVNFKIGCRSKCVFNLSLCLTKVQHHYSGFSDKTYCKVDI